AAHPHLPSFPTRRSSDLPLSAGSEGFSSSETFAAAYVFTSASAWRPPDVSFAVPSEAPEGAGVVSARGFASTLTGWAVGSPGFRSEEHTSELQSRSDLVC